MNVLLVDDEPGIREGLAAILRRKGHRVRTAATLQAAQQALGEERLDLIVSDWRLPDGTGETLLAEALCPVVVVSGQPEQVAASPRLLRVLEKPVLPEVLTALVDELESVDRGESSSDAPPAAADPVASLPVDCRHILRSALEILRPASYELADDGTFVTLRAPLEEPPGDARLRALEALGGDLRVLAPEGEPVAELRLLRDGRPRPDLPLATPQGPWPAAGDFGVDFAGERLDPLAFLEVLDRAARAIAAGRRVHFLNVPDHLRFFAEVSGRAGDMPIREKAGPRLPEVLASLWS